MLGICLGICFLWVKSTLTEMNNVGALLSEPALARLLFKLRVRKQSFCNVCATSLQLVDAVGEKTGTEAVVDVDDADTAGAAVEHTE